MDAPVMTRFCDLAAANLAGRKVDVVGFVDALLDLVREAGELHCALATEDRWRIIVGECSCEVELRAARAKLRMVCARLAVLCAEANDRPEFPYGGTGTIPAPDLIAGPWNVVFKNNPVLQEFAITLCRAQQQTVPHQDQPQDHPAAARDC